MAGAGGGQNCFASDASFLLAQIRHEGLDHE